jgi:hypothetical protein
MSNKTVDKNCKQCGILMKNVDASKLLCDDCNILNRKNSYIKHREKQRKIEIENNNILYENNFNKSVNQSFHLTSTGFNIISDLKVKSYCQIYNCKWIEIIKKFNKFQELYNYIITEYKYFYENNNQQDMHLFCKKHKYITYDIVQQVGIDNIMNDCDIQKQRYFEEDYKTNFLEIKKLLNKIPLYNEFLIHTKISDVSYANKFGFKGIVYDKIVKMYSTKEEYVDYKKMSKINQFETITMNNISNILNCNYIPQATFDWLKSDNNYKLKIDGYFEKHKLMIETDGQQHRKPMGYFGGDKKFKRQQLNDNLKDELVQKYGFKLLRIYIKEPWQDTNYLKKRLLEIGINIA